MQAATNFNSLYTQNAYGAFSCYIYFSSEKSAKMLPRKLSGRSAGGLFAAEGGDIHLDPKKPRGKAVNRRRDVATAIFLFPPEK